MQGVVYINIIGGLLSSVFSATSTSSSTLILILD